MIKYVKNNVTPDTLQLKWTWILGVLVRGDVKRAVIATCEYLNLEYTIEEEKGLFESLYIFEARGEYKSLMQLQNWITELANIYANK